MKYCRVFVTTLLAGAVILLTGAAITAQARTPDEQIVLDGINNARMKRGLPPFHWDNALARAAQAHADRMVKEKTLEHQYPGEPELAARAARQGAHFRVIAENIAMGPSPAGLVKQWMRSTPHRENILDPQLDAVGIGLAKRGGYYFGVADFTDNVPMLTHLEVEKKVGALLAAQGIPPSGSVRDARQTCEMEHGTVGGSSPRYVVRWESPDLSRLPAPLEKAIRAGRYHNAAVGACDSMRPKQNFTTYRVAVMLY